MATAVPSDLYRACNSMTSPDQTLRQPFCAQEQGGKGGGEGPASRTPHLLHNVEVIDTARVRVTMRGMVDCALAEINCLIIRHVIPVASVEHAVRVRASAADAEVRHLVAGMQPRAVVVHVVELRASLVPP